MSTTDILIQTEHSLPGKHNLPVTLDICYAGNPERPAQKPVVVFCHGFKGFKDWGTFPLVSESFAQKGFVFVKFNFSHNGTRPEQMDDLYDGEAFGNNNFEKEMDDLGTVLDWVCNSENPHRAWINSREIFLIGHSRGGAIALLKTIEESRVQKVSCWATVNDLEKYMYLSDVPTWKKTGVSLIKNTRTGIDFPLYWQFYENFMNNRQRFDLKKNLMKLDKPLLLLHGSLDKSVPVTDSEWIYEHVVHAIYIRVENGDHTFGGKHPWTERFLPEPLKFVIEETIEFFTF